MSDEPLQIPMPPTFSPNLAQEIGPQPTKADMDAPLATRVAREAQHDRRWAVTEQVFEGVGDELNALWYWIDMPWWKRLFSRPSRASLLEVVRKVAEAED